MDFCIKTLAQTFSQLFLWTSAAFSLLVGKVDFLDEAIRYVPLIIAIISFLSYMGLTRIKKKKEKLDIELKRAELENEKLENEIKELELKRLKDEKDTTDD